MNRLLFLLTCGIALLLLLLVVCAPWLQERVPIAPALLALFAADVSVRRAAVGCALALLVTAVVFFRSSGGKSDDHKRARRPRSRNTIGA